MRASVAARRRGPAGAGRSRPADVPGAYRCRPAAAGASFLWMFHVKRRTTTGRPGRQRLVPWSPVRPQHPGIGDRSPRHRLARKRPGRSGLGHRTKPTREDARGPGPTRPPAPFHVKHSRRQPVHPLRQRRARSAGWVRHRSGRGEGCRPGGLALARSPSRGQRSGPSWGPAASPRRPAPGHAGYGRADSRAPSNHSAGPRPASRPGPVDTSDKGCGPVESEQIRREARRPHPDGRTPPANSGAPCFASTSSVQTAPASDLPTLAGFCAVGRGVHTSPHGVTDRGQPDPTASNSPASTTTRSATASPSLGHNALRHRARRPHVAPRRDPTAPRPTRRPRTAQRQPPHGQRQRRPREDKTPFGIARGVHTSPHGATPRLHAGADGLEQPSVNHHTASDSVALVRTQRPSTSRAASTRRPTARPHGAKPDPPTPTLARHNPRAPAGCRPGGWSGLTSGPPTGGRGPTTADVPTAGC